MLRSFVRIFVSSGISLLLPLFVHAQASSFSVGTASAGPGQKSTGYLEVPAGVDAATKIPVVVINGDRAGEIYVTRDPREDGWFPLVRRSGKGAPKCFVEPSRLVRCDLN